MGSLDVVECPGFFCVKVSTQTGAKEHRSVHHLRESEFMATISSEGSDREQGVFATAEEALDFIVYPVEVLGVPEVLNHLFD